MTYTNTQADSFDELVEKHLPLVKRIASHLIARLPASVEYGELVQAGLIGLFDASRNYDPTQGAAFETYATIRVRGSMLDELRRTDWAPKSINRKTRDISNAIQKVIQRTSREPKEEEIADEMGISLKEYQQILQDTSKHHILSFDELGASEEIMAGNEPTPLQNTQRDHFQQRLTKAITLLPEREKLVVSLYYVKELNLKEIGSILEVSESRISQLLSQALTRIKAKLQDWV